MTEKQRYVVTVGGGQEESGATSVFFNLTDEEYGLLNSIQRKVEAADQDGWFDVDHEEDAYHRDDARRAEAWIAGAEERRLKRERILADQPRYEARLAEIRAAEREQILAIWQMVEERFASREGE